MLQVVTKGTYYLLHFYWVLLLLVPFGYEWQWWLSDDEVGNWQAIYLYDDPLLAGVLAPAYGCWVAYVFGKNPKLQRWLKRLLFLLSLVYFLLFGASLLSLSQDYVPAWGTFFAILLFPLLVIWQGLEYYSNRQKLPVAETDILDDLNSLEE